MKSKPKIITNLTALLEQEYRKRLTDIAEVIDLVDATDQEFILSLGSGDAFLGYHIIDEIHLKTAPSLKVIATPSVGYDSIDVVAATRRKIAVCNTPGVLTGAVSDLTVALIIMLSRRLLEYASFVKNGSWSRKRPLPQLANDIAGKTLGVIGFGRIGQEVARRMIQMNMKVIWYDTFTDIPKTATAGPYRPLDQLLTEADFVTIHSDLNNSSLHLIGARELSLMKPTSFLINTARGGIIDQNALLRALLEEQLAGAALDVLENEPPNSNERLLELENVIVLPHMGTATIETRRAMRELAVDNVIAVLNGSRPPAIVNPEIYDQT